MLEELCFQAENPIKPDLSYKASAKIADFI